MIIIGVDPSSDRHGVAIYTDGLLHCLEMWQLYDFIYYFDNTSKDIRLSIEDVQSQNFIYSRNDQRGKGNQRVARNLGMVQQAQVELMRICDAYGVPYSLHKPQKGNWADNKPLFQKLTGWTERSNRDTRSSAFFAWLELQKSKVSR